jgi:formylglycine-generating enzyme required for sulfatase activity
MGYIKKLFFVLVMASLLLSNAVMAQDSGGGPARQLLLLDTNIKTVSSDYIAIDVSGGPNAVSYPVTGLDSEPTLTSEYKTTKILLRKIESGGKTFTMGSPVNETARREDETQHEVTFTKDYYMGVFEITQRQYELVTGTTPSGHTGDMRPVEQVSWDTIRGGDWPGNPAGSGEPNRDTFIGKLRTKTNLNFDLPTEAQWEYAGRATTTRAYNDYTKNNGEGSDCLTAGSGQDTNLTPLAWYKYTALDQGVQHQEVGTKQQNLWGLYDMHGNVYEWCLDFYDSYSGDETDPMGPVTGEKSVVRGASWKQYAQHCRSAARWRQLRSFHDLGYYGFRLALP